MTREQLEKELDNMLNELNTKHGHSQKNVNKGNKMERDYTKTKLTYKLTTDGNMQIKIRNMSDNDMANVINSLARNIEDDFEMPIGQVLANAYLDIDKVKKSTRRLD